MLYRNQDGKDIVKISQLPSGLFRIEYFFMYLSIQVKTWEEAEAYYAEAYAHYTNGGRFGACGSPPLKLWKQE